MPGLLGCRYAPLVVARLPKSAIPRRRYLYEKLSSFPSGKGQGSKNSRGVQDQGVIRAHSSRSNETSGARGRRRLLTLAFAFTVPQAFALAVGQLRGSWGRGGAKRFDVELVEQNG